MRNSWTIGKKLAFGFGTVIVLMIALVALSFTGVGGIVGNAQKVIYGNQLDSIMAQREIDHLNWANQVNALFTDEKIASLSVQTDPTQCAFGKWYYGPERQEAEKTIPNLAEVLREIDLPHKHLHESAIKIGSCFIKADVNLNAELKQRKADHLVWTNKVKDVFLDDTKTQTEVQTDPHKCAFGQWYYSDAVAEHRRADAEFNRVCAEIEGPHNELHAGAVQINRLLAEGKRADAQKYFIEQVGPKAEHTCTAIDKLIAWNDKRVAGMAQAKNIFATETAEHLKTVRALLQKARETVKGGIITQEAMLSSAQATKRNVGLIGSVGIVLGAVLAIFIARGIVRALKRIIQTLAEGGQQVSSASTQVSAASQSLAEGATEQAAGLEETSSSLEEMSSMTKKNADNAAQANTLASQARKAAEEGAHSMERMNKAIIDIQKSCR